MLNASSPTPAPRSAIWMPIFAGLCASLVSIGLARFAYTPLIPSLIQAHWFSASDVVFLGAANLVGYLIGALIGHPLARRTSNNTALRLMMLAVTLAFFACAFPLSVSWFFAGACCRALPVARSWCWWRQRCCRMCRLRAKAWPVARSSRDRPGHRRVRDDRSPC
jgi:MFS family permease